MKILFAFNLYYYNSSELNSSYYFFVEPLKRMGHEVLVVDFRSLHKKGGKLLVAQTLKMYNKNYCPDILFTVPCTDEIPRWFLWFITNFTKTKTIAWNSDDDRRWNSYSKKYVKSYDYMITTYPQIYTKAIEEGYENVCLNQWGCNTIYNINFDLQKKYDISFVGGAYGDRPDIVKALKEAGLNVFVAGMGWGNYIKNNRETISQQEVNVIYNQSKLILVLSKGFETESRQLKARVFESPATGSCTLVEDNKYVRDYYEDGKHMVIFEGVDDLIKKAKALINDPEKREKIASLGYKYSHENHSWTIRMEKMLSEASEKKRKNIFIMLLGEVVYFTTYRFNYFFGILKKFIKKLVR